MPTLLQINSCVNTGSTGRIAKEIGEVAISNGWQSYIAYGRSARESKSHLIKIGDKCDLYEHALESRLLDNHGLSSRKSTQELINKIEDIHPDIIHIHNIHGYYINYEILFEYLAQINIPVIWTLHDCWSFTGHCAHFDYCGCDKWKTECSKCPQKKSYPASLLLDNSQQNYILKKRLFTSVNNMTIVPVSNWLGGLVEQSFLRHYPIQVINNGVDLSVFKPVNNFSIRSKYNIGDKFLMVAAATTWSSRKGLTDYCELSQYITSDCTIMLVGLTKRQISNLPSNIIGIERTESQEELVAIYSTADVVLNLSYEETFGLTTVEGFACGTPSIVYNKTASPELIDNSTGYIVEAKDYHSLLDSIQIIKDRGKAAYSLACRKRAEQHYNKNKQYNKYTELYNNLR